MKLYLGSLIFHFLFLLLPICCCGQTYKNLKFLYLTTDEGLKGQSVYSSIQDHLGFIWFGTENGLYRYDGLKFESFQSREQESNGLSGNVVFDIEQDGENLIICTNYGVDLYNIYTNRFTPIFAKIKADGGFITEKNVYSTVIQKTSDGDILISLSDNGIFKLNKDSLWLENLFFEPTGKGALETGVITTLFQDNIGRLWAGSKNKGVFRFDLRTLKAELYNVENSKIGSNYIYSIIADNDGILYACTDKGLFVLDQVSDRFIKDSRIKDNSDLKFYTSAIDSKGNMWLGTNGKGVIIIRSDGGVERLQVSEQKGEGLNNGFIRSILEDHQGNIWIGTEQGGVNYILNNNASVFHNISRRSFTANSISFNNVADIQPFNENLLMIGTDGGGLNIWDRSANTFRVIDGTGASGKVSPLNSVLTIAQDNDSIVYLGGYLEGFNKVDIRSNTFKRFSYDPEDLSSIGHDDVRKILIDRKGLIWVATNGGGLSRFDKTKEQFIRYQRSKNALNSLSSNYCITLYEDSQGRLWIGTYDGFSIFDVDKDVFLDLDGKNLPGMWIYAFYEHKDGMWIGSNKGLFKYNEHQSTYVKFTTQDGLPDNVICGILSDDADNIWISTTGGLSRFDQVKGHFKNFIKDDGIQGDHFNIGASLKNAKELFFGGSNGLTYFDPAMISTNNNEPQVYISKVTYGSNESITFHSGLKLTEVLELSYDEASSVSFHFTAINFINSKKNSYKYQLIGVDQNWIVPGNEDKVTYSNLGAGTYTFKVVASNNDNVWNLDGASVKLVIHPPIWRTPLAYLLYGVLLIGLLALIFRYFTLRVRYKKDLEIERVKREKSEELTRLKSEFLSTVSHELNTPLTLILAPLQDMRSTSRFDQRLIDIAWNNSRKLQALVKDLLDFQKASYNEVLMLTELELTSYITSIVENFNILYSQKKLELLYLSHIDSITLALDVEKIEKVFNNLLYNAFKFTPEGGKVTIELYGNCPEGSGFNNEDASCIYLKISDTGIGIKPSELGSVFHKYYRARSNAQIPGPSGYGIGLFLVKSYIELHKGQVSVQSEPGLGTIFYIKLPSDLKASALQSQLRVQQPANGDDILDNIDIPINDGFNSVEKPLLLVVEDNEEIRGMLCQLLKEDYLVLSTDDSMQALKLASLKMPDLIISDIMMPGLDGIALCEKIKKDVFTSHIPVVLLTALGTDEYRLKGLEHGADDYISKPFNPAVLKRRIYNLIHSRILLQKKFMTDHSLQLSEIGGSSNDEDFLKKAILIVEQHLEDPEFTVEKFSKELNMSESAVYRKLKGLTSQSSNQFIRTIRLKKAAQFLKNGDANVSEVCYMVGFNDVKYFRECFKKQFGVNPSDYSKQDVDI